MLALCGCALKIHIDLRPEVERAKIDGKTLVNADHPQVVEIWNLVFMEFNRLKIKAYKSYLLNMLIPEWDLKGYAWLYKLKLLIMIQMFFYAFYSKIRKHYRKKNTKRQKEHSF